MTEKIEPCALCRGVPYKDEETLSWYHFPGECPASRLGMWTLYEWNKFHRAVKAQRRKDFEAGVDSIFNEKGRNSDEVLEHKRLTFDAHIGQEKPTA